MNMNAKPATPERENALHVLVFELAEARAEIRTLRAQLREAGGDSAPLPDEGNGAHAKTKHAHAHPLPEEFLMFDSLPDDSLVDIRVVALLNGCSVPTAWRHVRDKLIPQPEHMGRLTRWRVGVLRAARRAALVSPDTAYASRNQERATAAAATKAAAKRRKP